MSLISRLLNLPIDLKFKKEMEYPFLFLVNKETITL